MQCRMCNGFAGLASVSRPFVRYTRNLSMAVFASTPARIPTARMQNMEAPARLLVIGTALFALLSGCGKEEGDYAATVSWAINGMLPTPDLCQEQGIVRGRLEVQDRRGENAQSLEGDCASTVFVPSPDPRDTNYYEYGGFEGLYAPYAYRASDHNPTLVGVDTKAGTPAAGKGRR